MTASEREGLIHDWNHTQVEPEHGIEFDDETLRDGLQSPSAQDPELDQKLELLHLMDKIGITTADVGLPGAGQRARDHIDRLVRETEKLSIFPNVACRTVISDIEPTVELAQRTGIAPVVYTFIGSSPIRMYAEDWDIERLVKLSRDAVEFAVSNGLEVSMVTEDTTRANPEHLKAIYGAAIQAGAKRLTLCDTCGHATPSGVRALMRFVKTEIIGKENPDVRIDWHGHRDRGLGLINTITAMEEGAQRLHATALGLGERAGNTEMDLLLINLKLAGLIDNDLTSLSKYCQLAHEACGVPFPENYPVRHQGLQEGRHLAREPRLLGRARRPRRPRTVDQGRADERPLERGLGPRAAPGRTDRGARRTRAREGQVQPAPVVRRGGPRGGAVAAAGRGPRALEGSNGARFPAGSGSRSHRRAPLARMAAP